MKVNKNLQHIGMKKDEMYMNKQCWHVENNIIYINKHHSSIIKQVKV
jgi:hypothetical protein